MRNNTSVRDPHQTNSHSESRYQSLLDANQWVKFRANLVGSLGSIIAVLGFIIYDGIDIFHIALPPRGYGIPVIVVGFALILWSGWILYRHSRALAQAERERNL
jgi:hypothetical protein